jgi:tRNA pseudouridine55 synthase
VTTRIVSVDGILNIAKPYGITSMDVVRRIKLAGRLRRVGHGGTLDPIATGVVPVCLGRATRLMEELINGTKDYRAVIELGVSTDTYDALGQVTSRQEPSDVGLAEIERAIEPLKGIIQQVPPMFSALKRQGKRLYELARAGIEVEREPRRVEVFRADLLDWSPPLVEVEVSCGRGFYMRSFAHDLGQALSCGGHIKSLMRLRTGPFHLSEAVPLSEMEERFADGTWREALYAPDVVLSNMRAAIVGRWRAEMIGNGRPLPLSLGVPFSQPNELCRVYDIDGGFVGILRFDASAKHWRPDRVFSGG